VKRCSTIREELLKLPVPHRLPESLASHVRACESCQRFVEGWARIEQSIPSIPVPRTRGEAKAKLLDKIATTPPFSSQSITIPVGPLVPKKWIWADQYQLIGSIAAAILLLAYFWPRPEDQNLAKVNRLPADPMLEELVGMNVALAQAKTTEKRVEQLAGITDKLQSQARTLAKVSSPDAMDRLARMYEQVMQRGLLPQATELDPITKRNMLDQLSQRLATESQAAEKLANEVPAGSSRPLRTIAKLAREGNLALQQRLQGNP
jgi:hypothetical protein